MSIDNSRIAEIFAQVHAQAPLIHQITNFVVMNDTANITLHLGASPVMAHAAEEVEEMVSLAGALVLNIGTLTPDWIEAMLRAGRKANQLGVPVVLDPVGAGATSLRTRSGLRLLEELNITIVRGNAGEIGALSGSGGTVKGVDSVEGVHDPEAVAQIARAWGTIVAVTGKRDLVSDGRRTLGVDNGHAWLATLTGTGCMATTTIAAFAAVEPDRLLAAAGGLAVYGLAAELAAPEARGPAGFRVAFLDQVYNLTPEQITSGVRVVELAPSFAGG